MSLCNSTHTLGIRQQVRWIVDILDTHTCMLTGVMRMLVRTDSRDRYYKLMEETSDGGARRQWETHGGIQKEREREREMRGDC